MHRVGNKLFWRIMAIYALWEYEYIFKPGFEISSTQCNMTVYALPRYALCEFRLYISQQFTLFNGISLSIIQRVWYMMIIPYCSASYSTKYTHQFSPALCNGLNTLRDQAMISYEWISVRSGKFARIIWNSGWHIFNTNLINRSTFDVVTEVAEAQLTTAMRLCERAKIDIHDNLQVFITSLHLLSGLKLNNIIWSFSLPHDA